MQISKEPHPSLGLSTLPPRQVLWVMAASAIEWMQDVVAEATNIDLSVSWHFITKEKHKDTMIQSDQSDLLLSRDTFIIKHYKNDKLL